MRQTGAHVAYYRILQAMAKRSTNSVRRFGGFSRWLLFQFARLFIVFLEALPINVSVRLGRIVGFCAWGILNKRRAVVRKNLDQIRNWIESADAGTDFSADTGRAVREVFIRSGANLLGGFAFNRMTPEAIHPHLQVEGVEHLRSALEGSRGAIILLAHMGPWEALAQLPEIARGHGIHAPFGALYRPLNNDYLDDWYKARREARGTRLFSRRDGFHKPVDFLRAGGMLGILADQKMRQGERVPFFGKESATMPIPGLFQRRSGAPVLAVSLSTISACRWRLRIRTVDISSLEGDSDRAAAATLCNDALERSLCDSLTDGFWFQDRFS
ncbi:MAG: lysophospholipid acyltransferase family protein [Coraliomargaritaceae bacterium]